MELPKVRGLPPIRGHFASDTHLFHPRNGAATKHLQMLYSSDAQQLFLNGDTIDFLEIEAELKLKGLSADSYPEKFSDVLAILKIRNAEMHLRVIDTLMWKADHGVRVVMISGNHDPGFDLLDGGTIHGIICSEQEVYEAGAGGGRFLVEHGHRFDPAYLKKFSGLYGIGSMFLDMGLWTDHALTRLVPSLEDSFLVSNTLKRIGKGHVNGFIDRAMNKAKDARMDGIICGHIHKLDDRNILLNVFTRTVRNEGVRYINCGDGLTHGTSVVHGRDGRWQFMNAQDIPASAAAILGDVNPLQSYRARSHDFLQTAWAAHLEHIKEKTPAVLNMPGQQPEIAVA